MKPVGTEVYHDPDQRATSCIRDHAGGDYEPYPEPYEKIAGFVDDANEPIQNHWEPELTQALHEEIGT